MRWMHLSLSGLVVAVVGCTVERRPEPADARIASAAEAPDASEPYDAGSVAGGPGEGRTFGIGRSVSRADVERWNTDVGPDGAELPAGKGDAVAGGTLYAARCAMCHGPKGEGIPPAFPALIGRDEKAEGFHFASDPRLVKTIGNYWPNATTVFDYVKRAMPLTAPGSLNDDEVYALTAYLLAANKVIPDGAVLDARALREVKMPYAGKFVPDDRSGGPVIR